MIRFNNDKGRVVHHDRFNEVRKNIRHIDYRREPEPELQHDPNHFSQIADEYGQGREQEPQTKGQQLLQVIDERQEKQPGGEGVIADNQKQNQET